MTVSEVHRLSDDALRVGLRELVAHDRTTTVRLMIHLREFDSRRLYAAEGYSCMRDYCMSELKMSRTSLPADLGRTTGAQIPRILVVLNDGSLTLTAVAMLTRHLQDKNADDLLAAAAHKTNVQVAELIAQRFPRPDLPTFVQPLDLPPPLAPAAVASAEVLGSDCQEHAVRHVEGRAEVQAPQSRVMPLAPQRYGVQFTISQNDRELLRRAKELLSHQLPTRDEAEVFVRALRAYVSLLEKRKYGVTDKPRNSVCEHTAPGYVRACVRREVRQRDQDRCTFVAPGGHRCEARNLLEFDHIEPVARGGKSTVDNLRLRCRAHNRLAAEEAFGREFMRTKVEEAQEAAEARKRAEEVVPWLQALGIRGDQARQAAARCAEMPGATLEERVTAALRHFGPRDVALRQAAPA
jgi:hypothetical protein